MTMKAIALGVGCCFGLTLTNANASCPNGVKDLGQLNRIMEFEGFVTGGNDHYCGVVNVTQQGCYKFTNLSSGQLHFTTNLLTAQYRRFTYFLSYNFPDSGRRTHRMLPAGQTILDLDPFPRQGGVFRYRIQRLGDRCE